MCCCCCCGGVDCGEPCCAFRIQFHSVRFRNTLTPHSHLFLACCSVHFGIARLLVLFSLAVVKAFLPIQHRDSRHPFKDSSVARSGGRHSWLNITELRLVRQKVKWIQLSHLIILRASEHVGVVTVATMAQAGGKSWRIVC